MEYTSKIGPNPQEDLCYWICSVATASLRNLAGRLAPYGISPHQFAILTMCSEGSAVTVSVLSRVLPIDPAAVSRNVYSLVQHGFLERRPSQRDRRSATLILTENGRLLLEQLGVQVEANNQMLLRGIDEGERDKFLATIKQILANTAAYEATRLGGPDATG